MQFAVVPTKKVNVGFVPHNGHRRLKTALRCGECPLRAQTYRIDSGQLDRRSLQIGYEICPTQTKHSSMSYSFSGFFIKNHHIDSNAFREGDVYREIVDPFMGCGILTPNMPASFPECIKYLNGLGVSGSDWIFLIYETWAGPVDYVKAIGLQAGKQFGPIEADGDPAEQAFFDALEAFGLEEDSGVVFTPFERGFWDND